MHTHRDRDLSHADHSPSGMTILFLPSHLDDARAKNIISPSLPRGKALKKRWKVVGTFHLFRMAARPILRRPTPTSSRGSSRIWMIRPNQQENRGLVDRFACDSTFHYLAPHKPKQLLHPHVTQFLLCQAHRGISKQTLFQCRHRR